jgi:adenosylmethionine-8-amino-7-oxononanoate aminotransferase
VRGTGDTIALSPPLIREAAHIDEMARGISDVLAQIG